jgi:hypothetical protein
MPGLSLPNAGVKLKSWSDAAKILDEQPAAPAGERPIQKCA